ncbi:hypothetical protein ACFQ6C_25770 [Streptomyces sp. NPDC056454]|uniref:hypothetical protein n=1 Tax=Streptomyces sp. NPDC056454 TaxID=3345823 RepID=UPI003699B3F1
MPLPAKHRTEGNPMNLRPAHAATVSRQLAKAGHTRHDKDTPGFSLASGPLGTRVAFLDKIIADRRDTNTRLDEYATTLRAHGYTVTPGFMGGGKGRPCLYVATDRPLTPRQALRAYNLKAASTAQAGQDMISEADRAEHGRLVRLAYPTTTPQESPVTDTTTPTIDITLPATFCDWFDGTGLVLGDDDHDPECKETRAAYRNGTETADGTTVRATATVLKLLAEYANTATVLDDDEDEGLPGAAGLVLTRVATARRELTPTPTPAPVESPAAPRTGLFVMPIIDHRHRPHIDINGTLHKVIALAPKGATTDAGTVTVTDGTNGHFPHNDGTFQTTTHDGAPVAWRVDGHQWETFGKHGYQVRTEERGHGIVAVYVKGPGNDITSMERASDSYARAKGLRTGASAGGGENRDGGATWITQKAYHRP